MASTTAAGLARRFGPEHLAGVETATADLADRGFGLLPAERKFALSAAATLDLDSTDLSPGTTPGTPAYPSTETPHPPP